ncbi:hypothetical protein GOP47_0003821 [Adiantum capillus-veneris]|uniref:Uncharacterized protein n=1 Tax=Adiantum capillus-veneris TaxID=13818 RepID=A0A9D4V6P1_ADICA|nr:hypothetical protein GOP47_0003821 [Adiantum capillus-veneris]
MALVPNTAQKALSPAALRAAARQSEGLLRTPSSLQAAIDAFLGDYSTDELKKGVSRLSEAMRNTKLALQRLEDSQKSAEDDIFARDSFKWQKKLQFRGGPIFNKYRQRDTCAYVAARMPAVYSAVYRVLSEISNRLPEFKPQKILDYGSGPGTAIWAMCEVWPRQIEHMNIVEPSEAMSFARRTLYQGIKTQLPKIKNFKSFDGFVSEVRPAEREHNLVIASYALGELHTQEERISVARQLWGLTTDMLVIIEPGHPRGSSIVRDIRSHILCMENKKLWRHSKKHKAGEEDEMPLTEQGKKIGAFVVAPCAHDGTCPLDGSGKYCHFTQRLERCRSQLLYKSPRGKSLRGYEDEKFSYVVLRRGCRPRIEWPLDRVDPDAFDESKKKSRRFYGVVVEEPKGGFRGESNEDSDEREGENTDDESEETEKESGEIQTESEETKEESSANSGTESEEAIEDGNNHGMSEESEEEDTIETEATNDEASEDSDAESDRGEVSDEEVEFYEEDEETEDEDAGAIADFGSGWGRILFHPARRGKRVVLDVCCSANRNGTKGLMDRITVSKTDNRVLHFQARRSRWGDLWPCGNIRQQRW